MTWKDPIVEEVRAIRDRTAARFNYDIEAIGRYYQEKQRNSDHQFVTRPPRPTPTPANQIAE